MAAREFDIVLWGATGATGSRAAHHLSRRCSQSGLRLAIGGRNREKLDVLRGTLPHRESVHGILVGDSHDTAFMGSLARRTRVVVSTVGPFALYGGALVAACAESGTQYCDLAAEPQCMRQMIDAHQNRARETGARIVHACGHDSIPSDLGVQFLQGAALSRFGMPCQRIATRITQMKGGFSGGTAASFLNAMKLRETDPEFDRTSRDPYLLCPKSGRTGPDGPDRMMPIDVMWDATLSAWTKPYFMGPMNSKIVRRSNAIMGYPYGRDFSYEETALTRGGVGGWWAAMRGALFGQMFLVAMAIPKTRAVLVRCVLPKSGEGPSEELRASGFYQQVLVGETSEGEYLAARVTGRGDPGVRSTTLMLTEAALSLAEDTAEIPVAGGFWTPASAMGPLLRNRIERHAIVTFEFIEARSV